MTAMLYAHTFSVVGALHGHTIVQELGGDFDFGYSRSQHPRHCYWSADKKGSCKVFDPIEQLPSFAFIVACA